MAVGTYITISDVKNFTVNQLFEADNDYVQGFIDATNEWFEGYAQSLDVAVEDIADPISQIVKDLLLAELNVRIGSAHIGGNDNDRYEKLFNLGKVEVDHALPRVKSLSITNGISRQSDTVNFGRIIRS